MTTKESDRASADSKYLILGNKGKEFIVTEARVFSLKFSYCSLGDAIALLKEQYAVGNVEVRIVRSRFFN